MGKEEFLSRLNRALSPMKPLERARTVQYYREILEDRMEDGLSEAEAVAEMDPVEVIAAELLENSAPPPRPRRSPFGTAMLIVGAPLWAPLLLAAGILALALYVVIWALVISLGAVVVSLAVCLPAGVVGLVLHAGAHPASGLFLLGAGLVCGGLALALSFPCFAAARGLLRAGRRMLLGLWRRIFRRKGEAA